VLGERTCHKCIGRRKKGGCKECGKLLGVDRERQDGCCDPRRRVWEEGGLERTRVDLFKADVCWYGANEPSGNFRGGGIVRPRRIMQEKKNFFLKSALETSVG